MVYLIPDHITSKSEIISVLQRQLNLKLPITDNLPVTDYKCGILVIQNFQAFNGSLENHFSKLKIDVIKGFVKYNIPIFLIYKSLRGYFLYETDVNDAMTHISGISETTKIALEFVKRIENSSKCLTQPEKIEPIDFDNRILLALR